MEGYAMCPSDKVQAFLDQILEEEDQGERTAAKADLRNQKVYDRIREIVLQKDGFKQSLDELEEKEERMKVQLDIIRLEREFNDLLNVLSMDSMEF